MLALGFREMNSYSEDQNTLHLIKEELEECYNFGTEFIPNEFENGNAKEDHGPFHHMLQAVKCEPQIVYEESLQNESDDEDRKVFCDISQSKQHKYVLETLSSINYDKSDSDMKFLQENYMQESLTCDVCNKLFSLRSELDSHMHTHTNNGLFCCDICNVSFCQKNGLSEHLRIHNGQNIIADKKDVIKHMRLLKGDRPFSCYICNKSFPGDKVLTKHMRSHTGARPFCCDVCQKTFCHKHDLSKHIMRTHMEERPFGCQVCTKSFLQKGDLEKHMRTHTGDRPYPCGICNKAFTVKHNLTRHMLTHIGNQPFS